MRRLISLLLLLLGLGGSALAQDLIHTTDQQEIKARVLEISTEEVCYKRFSNPDGPTYRLPVDRIRYIEYPNGERDIFTTEAETPATPQPTPEVTPAPAPQAAPATLVRAYQVGDIYDVEGVKGVVIATTDGGLHGLVLSIGQELMRWDTFEKEDLRLVGASSHHDGAINMEAVTRYIEENSLSWEHFPAFRWCRELGEGWYLPAIDEWLTISFNFNGGTRTDFNRDARNRVNDALKELGGKRLDKMLFYYSSTEQDERMALTHHMDTKPPYVVPLKKNGLTYLVRAVHKF